MTVCTCRPSMIAFAHLGETMADRGAHTYSTNTSQIEFFLDMPATKPAKKTALPT